ncbi:type IV secretory system conjugative DNA transfer family protein [Salmonella enterica]|nr:type IV secretory system conjugative DNA transfer family protein [Salmonella enterica]EIZ1383902.1 type IV secretory system conjugative DNA transfer family protein [Salmonella enterica]
MANTKKAVLPVILVWAAAVTGAGWLGSVLLLTVAGLPLASVQWSTFFSTFAYYGWQPALKKYLLAGIAGTAFPLMIALGLTVAMLVAMREKKSLHGNARLANDRDLAESGFFPDEETLRTQKYPSLLIGKMPKGRFRGRYLMYSGQQFLMLYAPTRSGKGVGIVVPNGIWYEESMVFLDIKLENFTETAGYRQKVLKQDVFLFSPDGYAREMAGGKVLTTHRYNPLFYIRRDPVYRYGDLDKIAVILFPLTGGENDTWTESSKNVFMSLVLWLLDTEAEKKYHVNMNSVLRLSVPADGTMLAKWMTNEIKERNGEKNLRAWEAYRALPEEEKQGQVPAIYPLSDDTVRLFRQFAAKEPKQQENVMLDFNRIMAMFANPVVAAATADNDFDLRDVRRKKMTVYYGISPGALGQYAKLTNLFFSQLLNENVRTLPEHDPSLKYQCVLMLDEFTSMGRLDVVQIALAFTAGYNLRFVFILQNKEQLFDEKKGYGKFGGETILKNCAVELFYPPKKVDDSVKDVSETIGYYDFERTQISRTSGKSASTTRVKQIEKRAVLLPQEIVDLRNTKYQAKDAKGKKRKTEFSLPEIVLTEFSRPFIAHKIVSFDDKEEAFFVNNRKLARENIIDTPVLDIPQDEVVRQLMLQQEREARWEAENLTEEED